MIVHNMLKDPKKINDDINILENLGKIPLRDIAKEQDMDYESMRRFVSRLEHFGVVNKEGRPSKIGRIQVYLTRKGEILKEILKALKFLSETENFNDDSVSLTREIVRRI